MKSEKDIQEMKDEIAKILSNPESTTETLKYYQGFLGGIEFLTSKDEKKPTEP